MRTNARCARDWEDAKNSARCAELAREAKSEIQYGVAG